MRSRLHSISGKPASHPWLTGLFTPGASTSIKYLLNLLQKDNQGWGLLLSGNHLDSFWCS